MSLMSDIAAYLTGKLNPIIQAVNGKYGSGDDVTLGRGEFTAPTLTVNRYGVFVDAPTENWIVHPDFSTGTSPYSTHDTTVIDDEESLTGKTLEVLLTGENGSNRARMDIKSGFDYGLTYTFSIYAKGEGNTIGKQLQTYSGLDWYRNFGELTAEWKRFEVTHTVGSNSGGPGNIGLHLGEAGDKFYVHSPQLEVGTDANAFVEGSKEKGSLHAKGGNSQQWNEAYEHVSDTDNPHDVTKAQVGLSNVDNTSDADKPISNATQTALSGKADTSHDHGIDELTNTGYGRAYVNAGGQDFDNGAIVEWGVVAKVAGTVTDYSTTGFEVTASGYYQVSFNITVQSDLSTGAIMRARLVVSGLHIPGCEARCWLDESGATEATLNFSGMLPLEADDTVEVDVDAVSGTADTVTSVARACSFNIHRIG